MAEDLNSAGHYSIGRITGTTGATFYYRKSGILHLIHPQRQFIRGARFQFSGFPFIVLFILLETFTIKGQTSADVPVFSLVTADHFTSREFFIKDVLDQRPETSYQLVVPKFTDSQGIVQGELKQGKPIEINNIRRFLRESVSGASSLRPVTAYLKECSIAEESESNNAVKGAIRVVVRFEWQRDGEQVKLLEYTGGVQYKRDVREASSIEPAIKRALINSVKYLESWIAREGGKNEALARTLQLNIEDYTLNTDADTLFYSRERPLNFSDFRSKPLTGGKFSASVFPYFACETRSITSGAVVKVQMVLKVYLVRGFSWVRDDARDVYTLNHEQRHFDIVKIIAERFKRNIRTGKLTVDNYQAVFSTEYFEALREMDKLQKQYDGETSHGTDKVSQHRWNQWIDKELNSLNVSSAGG